MRHFSISQRYVPNLKLAHHLILCTRQAGMNKSTMVIDVGMRHTTCWYILTNHGWSWMIMVLLFFCAMTRSNGYGWSFEIQEFSGMLNLHQVICAKWRMEPSTTWVAMIFRCVFFPWKKGKQEHLLACHMTLVQSVRWRFQVFASNVRKFQLCLKHIRSLQMLWSRPLGFGPKKRRPEGSGPICSGV